MTQPIAWTRQRAGAATIGQPAAHPTGSSSAPKPGPQPPNRADHHAQITLDLGDAAELAEVVTFLAGWLSGSQKPALPGSLAAFVGHPACNTDALRADLHRFVFLLGVSDGEELFGEPTP